MPNAHNGKPPIISSILIALIPVVFLSVAGAVISVGNIGDPQSYVVQAAACILSVLAGLPIVRKSGMSLGEVGFCRPRSGMAVKVFYYIPIVVLVSLLLIAGFEPNTLPRIAILLVFTLIVGINEELFYRGILIHRMRKIGIKKAILIASFLFGILHAANLLGGYKEPLYVALQVVFAFVFGILASEIYVITKSLLPVIIWHFLHDFISLITSQTLNNTAVIILSIQVGIMLILAFVFWRRIDSRPAGNT